MLADSVMRPRWEDSKTGKEPAMAGLPRGIRRGLRQTRTVTRLEMQREGIGEKRDMTVFPTKIDYPARSGSSIVGFFLNPPGSGTGVEASRLEEPSRNLV
jgi:hypothetical protein